VALSASDLKHLRERLTWQYAHVPATREAAKASVSALRRRARSEADEEAKPLWAAESAQVFRQATRRDAQGRRVLSAAEAGSATHRFLQLTGIEATASTEALQREAARLREAGGLSAEEFEALDFAALAAFWRSEVGRRIRARATEVRRELPFTARLSPADLAGVGLPIQAGLAADEFIVVQGIADLVVVSPAELWLLDFKTDQVREAGLNEKVKAYRPQLELYALALSRIYRRPVSERWLHFLSLGRTIRV
jgi:ATP-dependent helicase/nuclease subunit A